MYFKQVLTNFEFLNFDVFKLLRKSNKSAQKRSLNTPPKHPGPPPKTVGLRPPGGPGGQKSEKKKDTEKMLEMEPGNEKILIIIHCLAPFPAIIITILYYVLHFLCIFCICF